MADVYVRGRGSDLNLQNPPATTNTAHIAASTPAMDRDYCPGQGLDYWLGPGLLCEEWDYCVNGIKTGIIV